MVRDRTLAAIIACATSAVACSVLAPSDDELMGGSGASTGGTAGTVASGGGGGSPGGSAGTVSTGGSGGAVVGGSGGTGGSETGGGGSGGGGTGGSVGGTGGGNGGTGGSSCVSGTFGATPQPVALYLLLDRTLSVQGNGLWPDVSDGIAAYLAGNVPPGTEMGIQYFPLVGGSCAGAGYDTPFIPIALLPGNATAIQQSLASPPAAATSNTPIDGVLQGGIKGCQTYLASHPTTQCNFVLISDYNTSNICGSNLTQQMSYLHNARESTPRVLTYVIRLDTSASLESFAQAGGTKSAYPGTSELVLAASLKAADTQCQFNLPQNAVGGTVSWSLQGSPLTQVSDATACTGDTQYFVTPNAMVLCDMTCQSVTTLASVPVTATVNCN